MLKAEGIKKMNTNNALRAVVDDENAPLRAMDKMLIDILKIILEQESSYDHYPTFSPIYQELEIGISRIEIKGRQYKLYDK